MKFINKTTGTIIETNNKFVIDLYKNSEVFKEFEEFKEPKKIEVKKTSKK